MRKALVIDDLSGTKVGLKAFCAVRSASRSLPHRRPRPRSGCELPFLRFPSGRAVWGQPSTIVIRLNYGDIEPSKTGFGGAFIQKESGLHFRSSYSRRRMAAFNPDSFAQCVKIVLPSERKYVSLPAASRPGASAPFGKRAQLTTTKEPNESKLGCQFVLEVCSTLSSGLSRPWFELIHRAAGRASSAAKPRWRSR